MTWFYWLLVSLVALAFASTGLVMQGFMVYGSARRLLEAEKRGEVEVRPATKVTAYVSCGVGYLGDVAYAALWGARRFRHWRGTYTAIVQDVIDEGPGAYNYHEALDDARMMNVVDPGHIKEGSVMKWMICALALLASPALATDDCHSPPPPKQAPPTATVSSDDDTLALGFGTTAPIPLQAVRDCETQGRGFKRAHTFVWGLSSVSAVNVIDPQCVADRLALVEAETVRLQAQADADRAAAERARAETEAALARAECDDEVACEARK